MANQRQYMPDITANDAVCARLGAAADNDTLHHAYIIEGGDGMGKHMLASRLFMALCCEHRGEADGKLPCMTCPACKKILAGNNPDIRYVRREGDKASLGIDAIRSIREDIVMAPIESPRKTYVIEEAHLLTAQAQNALLLTLEEPPAYAMFILLCTSADELLETIRSRAPVLRLSPVPTDTVLETIREIGRKEDIPLDELRQIALAGGGSIGRAIKLTEKKSRAVLMEKRRIAAALTAALLHPLPPTEAFPLLDSLGSKREDLGEMLSTVQTALRDLLLQKQDDRAPLLFYADRDVAENLCSGVTQKKLLTLWQQFDEARDAVTARNANVYLTMSRLALSTGLIR